MTYVRVLKPTGFERVGQVVDWRGPVDEFVANGTLELTNAAGEALEKVEEVAKEETPVVEQEATKVEEAVVPEVQQEVADIKANIVEEEKALEQLETQVEQK